MTAFPTAQAGGPARGHRPGDRECEWPWSAEVLRAVWLFDGTGSALISDPVVVLEGGTILSAGSGGRVPHCAAVIDVAGAILLPGLVDNYVHLGFDASAGPVGRLAASRPGSAPASWPLTAIRSPNPAALHRIRAV
jgi:hypothetical protein